MPDYWDVCNSKVSARQDLTVIYNLIKQLVTRLKKIKEDSPKKAHGHFNNESQCITDKFCSF